MFQDELEGGKKSQIYSIPFEQLSGFKINFHKSKLFCLGKAQERSSDYTTIHRLNGMKEKV